MIINNKIIPLFFVSFLVGLPCFFSQDFHFSQFYESPLQINAACAGGSSTDFRLAINYKNQWKNIITPFKTIAVAFDAKIQTTKKKSYNYFGYGLTLLNDKVGLNRLTTNQANANIAYHLSLNRSNNLSAGVNVGVFQKSLNTVDLKWDSQYDGKGYDPSLPTKETNLYERIVKVDLGVGIVYRLKLPSNGFQLEFGNSFTHLTQPKISFYSKSSMLNFKYLSHLIIQTQISGNCYFSPMILFMNQGAHKEFTAGGNFKVVLGEETRNKTMLNTYTLISSSMQFGIFYRLKDAVIFTTSLDYKKSATFGLSYDITMSKLNKANKRMGGLELSVVLKSVGSSNKKGNLNDR